MIGGLVHSADFQRVLATAPKARSAHFAAHHASGPPRRSRRPASEDVEPKLSTGCAEDGHILVDKPRVVDLWAGFVIPKRLARRAVTRQLIKRQMREALRRHASTLAPGLWVLRLRAGFDRATYVSAASAALRAAARTELDALLASASRR